MRILIVQRFDLASVSCARRVISQARELSALGHDVTLVDFPHPKRQAQLGRTSADIFDLIYELDRRPAALLSNISRLSRLHRPDVVHLWKSYPDAAIPALAYAWRNRIPVHYDWDDWEEGITYGLTGSRLSAALELKWERALCRWADGVSVASRALREAALAWGRPPECITDLPVGVDPELFHPQPPDPELGRQLALDRPVLLYLGQLEVESYVLHAIDVLRCVRQTYPEASLLVVGGGRLSAHVTRAAKQAGLFDAVHVTGYVNSDEVPRYCSLADVALAPFEDNQVTRCKSPLKIVEYAAMGLPVVASDVGEARTMLEGHPSRLAPEGDAGAMGAAVVELLKEKPPRPQTVPSGLTWRRHAEILAEAYQRIIDSAGR